MSWVMRSAWIAALLGSAGLGAYEWRTKISPNTHAAYSADIRELQALDARLDGQVMQSRQALVAHYDDMVRTMTAMNAVLGRLDQVPPFLARADEDELHALVARTRTSADHKASLVEEFKSENAVLRNSARFFPHAAKSLRDDLQTDAAHLGFAKLVNDALVSVLQFSEMPGSREAYDKARAAVEDLAAEPPPDGFEEDVDVVVRHAETVLDRGVRVDGLTSEIVSVPTARTVLEADTLYERAVQTAMRERERRRGFLFVVALGGVVLLAVDIIVRLRRSAEQERRANERLAEANEALLREKERERELSELKSRFVSMTSHEFRTPLSVILSSTELLEAYGERWTPAKKADHFARIKDATRGMEELLDSILVIGKSEVSKLGCNPSSIDLARWTRRLVDAFHPTLSKSHRLDASIDEALAEQAQVDEALLSHILTNLLSNAVKYSPGGGIVRFEARREDGAVVFVVADEGIGIPKEDEDRLFDSFHRCSNVGHIRGTGLGLAVVKRAVDAHGGRLAWDSAVGRGTTFTVTIPLVHPEAAPSVEGAAA